MEADILQTIVANKRIELEQQKKAVPMQTLLGLADEALEVPTRSMRQALEQSLTGIIAEFKRKSPSKGWLHPNAKVEEVVPTYEANGASACSILTDSLFFGGGFGDLHKASQLVDLPLLRKDFMVDTYQLFQARALGADAVLLIASVLTKEECQMMAETAHSLQLEVLLEIHRPDELAYLTPEIDMLGVNNRNLGTFYTDVQNSVHLSDNIHAYLKEHSDCHPLLVAESGISKAETIRQLRKNGYRGFLIGETFMKTEQPGNTLHQFIQQVMSDDC